MKVSVSDTFRAIGAGDSALYDRDELGSYPTVYSALLRLNREAGFDEYDFDMTADGRKYIITRNYQGK